jgi:hypothetical protein
VPPREPAPGGLPQRPSGPNGLPKREPGSNGLPQRDSSPSDLPQRDPNTGGLPQRDPGIGGLPQRQPAATNLPQRDALSGLPQRQPGSQVPPGLQRDAGSALPQRESASGLGLPQQERGTSQSPPSGEQPALTDPGASLAGRDPGRHSFKADPAKAASFFQTRLQPAAETNSPMDSPIFAEMMSAWLTDPNPDRSQVAASFESPGDEGWQAAQRASEAQAETKTAAGLPQRNPGGRLVPGAVNGVADRAARRDPETIRTSLSRHQQGVRDGRALKATNLTGDKGDR